jgi:parvulin-like peptidyl-prolyl isomerase
MVDGIFITRSLAERARAEGLDKDPAVQRRMQQAGEAVLADLYRTKLNRETAAMNLEPRARELYRADPSKFRSEEHVHLQHVLVNLQGRTREQAQARAKMIAEKARAEPAEFLTFAQQYSDDPEKRGNRGDLGLTSPKSLSEGLRTAVEKMKPGEVSEPIETEHGFHIVKFIERKAGQQMPYEMVKDSIIRDERARLQKARMDQVVTQIRGSSTVTINTANVEALVVPLPPEMTGGKVLEQAAKK